jgi:hypothetical protein
MIYRPRCMRAKQVFRMWKKSIRKNLIGWRYPRSENQACFQTKSVDIKDCANIICKSTKDDKKKKSLKTRLAVQTFASKHSNAYAQAAKYTHSELGYWFLCLSKYQLTGVDLKAYVRSERWGMLLTRRGVLLMNYPFESGDSFSISSTNGQQNIWLIALILQTCPALPKRGNAIARDRRARWMESQR